MTYPRITFLKGRYGDLEARANLSGVRQAMRRSVSTGKPAVVIGPHSFEEMQSYLRDINSVFHHRFVAVGSRALDISDLLYPYYQGRIRILRRVAAFLGSHTMIPDSEISKRINQEKIIWPDDLLKSYLTDQYIASRKRPEGAEVEISEFLDIYDQLAITEPVVMVRYYDGWNAEQFLVALNAASNRQPIILIGNEGDLSESIDDKFVTEPITLREAFSTIGDEFNISDELISKNYRLWRASRFRGSARRHDIKLDSIAQISSLGDFTSFLLEAVEESRDIDQQPIIPYRIVAPLMFREQVGSIGVDHTAVTGITYINALGGIRAFRNLTADLRSSAILSNVVVGINPCLDRIASILDRIITQAPIEESDVVEFGVEFSYLESRVLHAQDNISKESMEFVLSYTGEGHKLLERFEPWQTYQAEGNGGSDTLGAVSRDIAAASIRLLRSASAEGLLDPTAAGRVAETIESADIDAPLKRASLAASTKNLGAAVGRSALARVKTAAVDIAKNVENDAKAKLSEKASNFIQSHANDLAKLASVGSSKWLPALIKLINGD